MAAWDRGAEAFPNLGSDGKTDMILKIDGNLYEIDVKAMKWKPVEGIWGMNKKVHEPNVWQVCVNPETREIRWPYGRGGDKTPQCPPGLERFWD
jgi:hypothetical protein